MAHFTKVYHRKPYAAISPTLPELSQAGRTVLITGGSAGIGFATARAFVAAAASQVIIVGRRPDMLSKAVAKLEKSKPQGSSTIVSSRECDVADLKSMDGLWKGLADDKISVNVLILNAALLGHAPVYEPEKGIDPFWKFYQTNVLGSLQMLYKFLGQGSKEGKVLLFVSSAAIQMNPGPTMGGYASSKIAASSLFQHLADEKPVDEIQVINIHPGVVYTEGAENAGYQPDALPYDSEDLPASFMVWAASKRAAFLHGRFVWAHWDVDELESMKGRMEADDGFLKIGLQGTEHVGKDFFEQLKKLPEN